MKQIIVIEVLRLATGCEKCRSKALQIAAVAKGVNSVSLEGEDRDQVVVIGDKVDSVCLTKALRKKFRHANILSVEEVKENKDKKEEETKPKESSFIPLLLPYPYPYPYPPPYMLCECPPQEYSSSCVIM